MSYELTNAIRAAIDIGTNTAHLIVAEIDKKGKLVRVLKTRRHYIFLAEQGIQHIARAAEERLIYALRNFQSILSEFDGVIPRICATEALRKADNGQRIRQTILTDFGWTIEVISGMREAELIFTGVSAGVDMREGHYLVMDIGGGSVEFIGVVNGEKKFMYSFPIGIANLYNRFHQSEPISKSQVEAINQWLDLECAPMIDVLSLWDTRPTLVGCAGTFELLVHLSKKKPQDTFFEVPCDAFGKYAWDVIAMDLDQRKQFAQIPDERVVYVVVAFILIEYILSYMESSIFIVSKYALKEGILLY